MPDDTFPPLALVKSSQISAIGFDPPTGRMRVRFVDRRGKDGAMIPGGTYEYSGVAPEDHAALIGADSIGAHFHQLIRKNPERLPYRRIA